MSIVSLLLMQAAAGSLVAAEPQEAGIHAGYQTLPDIQIRARVEIESVEIDSSGKTSLKVFAKTGAEDAEAQDREVTVQRNQPPGQKTYDDLVVELDASARFDEPLPLQSPEETGPDIQ